MITDALSDLLRAVKLSGGVFLDAEFTAPWCVAAQAEPWEYRHLIADPARVISFHYVVEGKVLLQVGSEPPLELRAGSIVLLPRNEAHTLASDEGLRPA